MAVCYATFINERITHFYVKIIQIKSANKFSDYDYLLIF